MKMKMKIKVLINFMGYSFRDVRRENLFVDSIDNMLRISTMICCADFEDRISGICHSFKMKGRKKAVRQLVNAGVNHKRLDSVNAEIYSIHILRSA